MTISITKSEVTEKPQESEVVLSVQGVSKKFCRDLKRSLFYGVQDITSELLGIRQKSETLRKKEFWALKDVRFELRRGEALGLVGKNGSGKSTLLRIIAGLIKPDTGSVEVNGRVAPLIALGAGFNPILTGRENIYANMAILGLSKQEIDERFNDVVKFAEIDDAIDAPVQSYSSGMRARLGFASAIYTEPDILLIDEVLAVGDSRFRMKCFRKLHELHEQGKSFILVSHNSHSILSVCSSAVYLKIGKFMGAGDTSLILKQYEKELFFNETKPFSDLINCKHKTESRGFHLRSIFFRNQQGEIIEAPTSGKPTYLCIEGKADEVINNILFNVVIKGLAEGGETILKLQNENDRIPLKVLPGLQEIQIQMPYLGLRIGSYIMNVYVKKEGIYSLDYLESFCFKVKGSAEITSKSLFYQPRSWHIAIKNNLD